MSTISKYMKERRAHPRKQIDYACGISDPPLNGKILNVSQQGAKLEIDGAADEFVLSLSGETQRPCSGDMA